ncbi:MAG: murein L,D-transpeptidase, partial [Sphingobacteriaceae bacterium]
LVNHLETQQSDGILKSVPYKKEFSKLVNQAQSAERQKPDINLELMLSAQYFNYARNKWGGAEADKTAGMGWYLPKKKLSYSELLQKQLGGAADSVEQLAVIPQYLALRKALNNYQQLEKKEKDIVVPFTLAAAKINPGDTSSIIPLLCARLHQLGDLQNINGNNAYNNELQQAVINFKERHGLAANEKLNQAFFKQLNVPLRKRIEAMIINLERMRWIPVDDHGGEYILVNIPEYKLHYYINNQLTWDCKVVVGKVMNKTVIFSGHMQYIVFSPYWYVPQSIINKEIKPGMARNANYLANHRMEWNGGNVRQKPGNENSLGLVKFIFPNSNNIYLHDTPSKPLFNEDARAFSHGCVRVEQPRELAIRILKQNPAWTPDKIDVAMHAGTERTVMLKNKIPVYIGYFTAFVNSKGMLNFRDDVYKRDDSLLGLLMKN